MSQPSPPDFSLPACSEALVKRMDASSRRKWRLLSRACCQHVYDETKTLTWVLCRPAWSQHPDRDEAFAEAEAIAKKDVDAAVQAVLSAAQAGTAAVWTSAEAAEAKAAPPPFSTPAATAAALATAVGTMTAAAAAVEASPAPGDALLKAFRAAAAPAPRPAAATAAPSNLEQGGCRLARLQHVEACIELVIHVHVADHVARVARQYANSLADSFAHDTGVRLKFVVTAAPLQLPHSLLPKLRNLRTLSCRAMVVDSLAGLPAQMRLEKLDISHTSIQLAQSAEQLRQLAAAGLRCLVAQGREIGSADADALCALAPSLHELNLDIMRYDMTGPSPLSALSALTGLSSLSMRGQDRGIRTLPALPALTGLTRLDLSGWLRLRAAEQQQGVYQSLGQALLPLTKLQALLLSVGEGDAETSAAGVGYRTGAAACRSISAALEQSRPPLTALVLEHSLMAAAGAAALARALPVFLGTLTVLNLRGGFMAAEGALALAPGLSRLGALRQLDLAGNLFGDEGMAALAPALGRLLQLRGLCLADDRLGAAGAGALAAALWDLASLEELLLGRNELGDEGAEALRPALASLRALRLLDLGRSLLSSTAALEGTWRAAVPSLEEYNGGSLWIKQLGGTAAGHEGYEDITYDDEDEDDEDDEDEDEDG